MSLGRGTRIQGRAGLITPLCQQQKSAVPGEPVPGESCGYLQQHEAYRDVTPTKVCCLLIPVPSSPSPLFCCDTQKA